MGDVTLGMLLPFVDGLVTSGPFMRDFAATIEAAGVESVWAVEHVVVAEDYQPGYPYSADGRMPSAAGAVPMPDPLEVLSFVAGATEHLVLGTAVVVAPLHSPVVLAKRAATLDTLSGGRFLLGLGIGWQREEYAAVGAAFDRRGLRLDEAIGAMRALWRDRPASYAGETVAFDRVHSLPQPTGGRVPIVLGGNSGAAVDRAGRLADGWFPYTIDAEGLAAGADRLAAAATAAGRRPEDVPITVWPGSNDPSRELDVDWVRPFVAAGATRLVVRPRVTTAADLAAVPAFVERYQEDVLTRL
ncbi:MAG: class F420-dependent oxidoreductase [Actinomycetia bacterium]|nr:class F420-dependent oxidoreductase [Actinomycetes bacterium]